MNLLAKKLLRITLLLAFVTLICLPGGGEGFCDSQNGLSVSKKIYKTSLAALENIINVQDTVQGHIELLEDKEKELTEEKQKLQLVSQDLQNMFPSGRALDRTTKGFFKRLKDLDKNQEKKQLRKAYNEQKAVNKKKASPSTAVMIGALAGILGAALGVLVWQGLGNSNKKSSRSYEAREAARWKCMSSYLQSELSKC